MKKLPSRFGEQAGIGKIPIIQHVFDKLNVEGKVPDKTLGLISCYLNGKQQVQRCFMLSCQSVNK